MSDTMAAGAPAMNADIRVLLAITAPRTRMHIRRLLASAPGMDVVGHASSAMQASTLLQRGGVDFIIIDAPDDPGFVQDVLGAVRSAGIEVAVLTEDSRLSSQGLGSRVHLLRPPPDIAAVVPQSPFCQSLLSAVLHRNNTVRRAPVNTALR